MTLEGGGRVAPALRHTSSQTNRASAITTTGGTRRAAISRDTTSIRFARGGTRGGASGSTVAVMAAVLAGSAITGSVLTRGMFIAWLSASSVTSGSHLDALDRQALEVGGRVGGIEHLAVKEGLLCARGRRREIRRRAPADAC